MVDGVAIWAEIRQLKAQQLELSQQIGALLMERENVGRELSRLYNSLRPEPLDAA